MPKRRVIRHEVTQPLEEPYRYIPLTQGQNAIVDAEDFNRLMEFNWFAHWCPNTRSFYAKRWRADRRIVGMHTEVFGCKCDHIRHDTLDNRKANLRPCTHAENQRNVRLRRTSKSGFKGVAFHKRAGKWEAYICSDGGKKHLGLFQTKHDAAKSYDVAAKKVHGEFALLNFP